MNKDTSWQKVASWYSGITKDGGHYYHQHVVIPGVVRLLNLPDFAQVLDVGCGSGVLARELPKNVIYQGVDASTSLIEEARKVDKNEKHRYTVLDATKSFELKQKYSHATIILALQNMKEADSVIRNTTQHLADNGVLIIVLNHPAFRIPRQSSWEVDPATKIQSRKINKYMSFMEIPIKAHPGAKHSVVTWSYHLPISAYSQMLFDNGLLIEKVEEWTSDKQSVGKAAKSENRAREEFPLFLTIKARKIKLK